ncbi:MAG: alpha/beta hydrolase, partial [Hyphomicrobiales bacterium]
MPSADRKKPASLDMPDGQAIAYLAERRTSPSFTSSGLFWLGGFNSAMDGTKANALARWAKVHGRECVRFDYSGHGASDGRLEDGTISQWLDQAAALFAEITTGPQILIGSSMGGWIALLLARKLLREHGHAGSKVRGMVLIAPAADMTERLMWDRFSDEIKQEIMAAGVHHRPSRYGDGPYPITRALIE